MDGIAAGVRKSWVEMCSSSCCLERGGKGGWFKVKSIIIFALLCTVYLASSMNEIWLSRSRPIDDDDINYLKDVTLREVGGALLLLIIIVFDGPAIVWSWVSFILPSKNIYWKSASFRFLWCIIQSSIQRLGISLDGSPLFSSPQASSPLSIIILSTIQNTISGIGYVYLLRQQFKRKSFCIILWSIISIISWQFKVELYVRYWIYQSKVFTPLFSSSSSSCDDFHQFLRKTHLKSDQVRLFTNDRDLYGAFLLESSTCKAILVSSDLAKSAPSSTLLSILAHEIGHNANGDLYITGIIDISYQLTTGILSMLFLWNHHQLFPQLGFQTEPPIISIIIGEVITSCLRSSFYPMEMLLSRNMEYRADSYAASLGYAGPLVEYFSNIHQAPPRSQLYHLLRETHPTIQSRIDRLLNN